MASRRANPAMCEDADEDDRVVEGSYKYARSNVTSTPSSPVKQEMNTSRKKSSSKRRDSLSPNDYTLNDSDSTAKTSSLSRRDSKAKEKRPASRSKGKDVVVEVPKRPVVRAIKTTPAQSRSSDEASYYGISQQTVASSRPRAHTTARPQSYYGPTSSHPRPPLSHSAYYHVPQGPPIPTSYPPPWMNQSPMSASPLGGPPPQDYFSRAPDNLAARFQRPESRPQSAMGFRPSSYGHDEYDTRLPDNSLIRQSSLTKRSTRDKEDRVRMPPPPRPSTVQPQRVVFKPPPPLGARKSDRKTVVFDDEDFNGDSDLFQPTLRHTSVEYGITALPIRTRRPSSGQYDGYTLEPASKSRRASQYGYEDKIKHAARYQEDVSGGPVPNLTAENLRHVKNGGSSHSTRSSASRDESSYRQSATTRTTRSGSGDDDITIKLPSGAVVEVGNAKINCTKGGEINIGRSGGGSDRGTVFGDDRKSRIDKTERPPTRTRASSQSTYSRSPYAPPTYPYPYPGEYAPPMHPPYPAYPRADYDHNYF